MYAYVYIETTNIATGSEKQIVKKQIHNKPDSLCHHNKKICGGGGDKAHCSLFRVQQKIKTSCRKTQDTTTAIVIVTNLWADSAHCSRTVACRNYFKSLFTGVTKKASMVDIMKERLRLAGGAATSTLPVCDDDATAICCSFISSANSSCWMRVRSRW